MKASTIVIWIACISLFGMMFASATIETKGGMMIIADNGGALSGIRTSTSTSQQLGESTFTRDINEGDIQGFAALFAKDDNTFGTVSAVLYTTSNPGEPAFATLPFKAPSTPMNILLKQSTRPSTIASVDFTTSIKNAGITWNNDGGVRASNPFFGSVSDASSTQRAQANDKKFVHSFAYSTGNWLAGNWLTSRNGVLIDSDVIYNKRYTFSTKQSNYPYVDLQTVALHELGHNVGLDDIYNKAALKGDETEVMNDYHWGIPKLTLGLGDKNGLKAIYGS
jgi:hypothetical protein